MTPPSPATVLNGANAAFVESIYRRYQSDPAAVDTDWREYFEALERQDRAPAPRPRAGEGPLYEPLVLEASSKQAAVLRLINAHRFRGHQAANLDPLGLQPPEQLAELDPEFHGLTEADLGTVFNTGSLAGPRELTLAEISALMCRIYCGTVGSEYMHIVDTDQKRWLQQRIESVQGRFDPDPVVRERLFERLTAAEALERYLHNRYVGQKRFSLEGGESLIPMLDALIQRAGAGTVREVILGMAHRGRLNVLVNILGKSPAELFMEFEGSHSSGGRSGDVKYHLGYSSDVETPAGPLHLALAFNPSHLEIINPVVQGSVKARQQRRGDSEGNEVLPVLIHGDAAFAGQGVVMESLNMSMTRGFSTGGTVHIVINNQIGFTTSVARDARSTRYCTDVAKMVDAPIFHVNGDDPEAVLFATRTALDFRMTFHKDVIIDLVCYRRHGHNEADEPSVTQPVMYRTIKDHPTARELYARKLVEAGVVSADTPQRLVDEYRARLDRGEVVALDITRSKENRFAVNWAPFRGMRRQDDWETGVPLDTLTGLAARLQELPRGFKLHPRVAKIMDDRRKMAAGALAADWGFAETMAYATLLAQGYRVRLCGQDSGRGTFFHRHAVLYNQKDGKDFRPLKGVPAEPGMFAVIDSLLSEAAVLGFELGYATAEPNALVIWEGQFGDFVNGAQVVIDQFISSGETKWDRLNGLVMLLPHGLEGQGPEHSSARLERFLQLCAEYNMQVCVPTTPGQMFHMLRRQMLRPMRKPLVVMSPKSLLRHRLSVSALEEFTAGGFRTVIGETDGLDEAEVRRIVMCTGRVYFDLLERRRAEKDNSVAIVRIEQLYPFPRERLSNELNRYPNAREVIWCQEEPRNQGCWYQSRHHLSACIRDDQVLHYAGRKASASPASGYHSAHVEQLQALVEQALFADHEERRRLRAAQG